MQSQGETRAWKIMISVREVAIARTADIGRIFLGRELDFA